MSPVAMDTARGPSCILPCLLFVLFPLSVDGSGMGNTNNNCAPISVAQILRHWPKWRELARGAKKRFEGDTVP